jgi:hypothetical protein
LSANQPESVERKLPRIRLLTLDCCFGSVMRAKSPNETKISYGSELAGDVRKHDS